MFFAFDRRRKNQLFEPFSEFDPLPAPPLRARRAARTRDSASLAICCTTPDAAAATPDAISAIDEATSATRFSAPLVPDFRLAEALRLVVFLAVVLRAAVFRPVAFRLVALRPAFRPRAADALLFFLDDARDFDAAAPRRFVAGDFRFADAFLVFFLPDFRAAISILP